MDELWVWARDTEGKNKSFIDFIQSRTSWANSWQEYIRKEREEEDREWQNTWKTHQTAQDGGSRAERAEWSGGQTWNKMDYVLEPGPFGMPNGLSSKDWFRKNVRRNQGQIFDS